MIAMGKHLVFVGGGHAHMTALLNIRDTIRRGHRVTLISLSPYQYYSGMGPGMLSGLYRPQEIRFHVRKMAEDRGAAFIHDTVVRVDPMKQMLFLQSGTELHYDVVSFNTGSEVPMESLGSVQGPVVTVKPIINLLKARKLIIEKLQTKPLEIAVLGGGPAGVELAGNVRRLVSNHGGAARITLVAGAGVFSGFPETMRRLAVKTLAINGIEMREGVHAQAVAQGSVALSDGGRLPADVVFAATGTRPSSLFRDSDLPTGEDGGLLVNSYLQSVGYPEIFGGGDCISLKGYSLEKVGVYAVRQNPILHHNLLAFLGGGRMKQFRVSRKYHHAYLLIFNMGDGTGILRKGRLMWDGKLAFKLKDYIDRRFMRTFQVSGELAEEE